MKKVLLETSLLFLSLFYTWLSMVICNSCDVDGDSVLQNIPPLFAFLFISFTLLAFSATAT